MGPGLKEAVMSQIKCPKCGHMNNANAEHCTNCGYRLNSTKQASTELFLSSLYKEGMACPAAAGNVD